MQTPEAGNDTERRDVWFRRLARSVARGHQVAAPSTSSAPVIAPTVPVIWTARHTTPANRADERQGTRQGRR